MSRQTLIIHIGIMLLLSLVACYGAATINAVDLSNPYQHGRIFGRALASVLLPVILYGVWRAMYSLVVSYPKPSRPRSLWLCWAVLFLVAFIGSILGQV